MTTEDIATLEALLIDGWKRQQQLIAAAPALLAACKDCMEDRWDWGSAMYAAIEKAEGRR